MGKKQNKAQEKGSSGSILEVFVSGLPYETTEDDIKGFFDFASNPHVKLPKYQDTGRCLGYGHVVFESKEEVQKALAKDHQNIGKRYINVQLAKGQKETQEAPDKKNIPIGCKVLFIKNLPYSVTKEELQKQFSSCGIVQDVRMIKNWQTKQFKGFAYIDYKDNGSVKKAISKYAGKSFQGRKLILDAVTTGMKKGFKRFEGEGQEGGEEGIEEENQPNQGESENDDEELEEQISDEDQISDD